MEENFVDTFINDLLQDRNLAGNSSKWANWKSQLTITTCKYCVDHHGTIIDISVLGNGDKVNAHKNCKCIYVPMRTKLVGSATNMGYNGADAQLYYLNRLPNYYVNSKMAYAAGWKQNHKKLDKVLPGKMIGGDIYTNDDQKLPFMPGRIWYEADINYTGGKRNRQRILYSNDGLLFVTYDHYHTFYEIIE